MTPIASATDVYLLTTYNGSTWYGEAYQSEGANSWNYVGTAGKPAFAIGWDNFGGNAANLAFRQAGDDVEIIGVITIPALVGTGLVFTLPAAYVPASTQIFPGFDLTTGNAVCWTVAFSTGRVSLSSGALNSGDQYIINGRYSLSI